jgi:polysaccharide biosynthesis transport protein
MDAQLQPPFPGDIPRKPEPGEKPVTRIPNRPVAPRRPGMTLGDIYYVLFRQKWKIIACSLLGVLAAAALFELKRPVYQSQAKLLIRYVLDSKTVSPDGTDAQIRTPDEGGNNIINTEVEILTSYDLAQQVADSVGVDKILGKSHGTGDRNEAAMFISKHLLVEVPSKSSVLEVVFQHPDPDVVQPVLAQLIEKYLKRHVDIHQAVGVYDGFLKQQTDQLKTQLSATEQELQKARDSAGLISLTDTKKVYTDQISKIRQELFEAEAELAERRASLDEMTKLLATPSNSPTADSTVAASEAPMGLVVVYKGLCGRLDMLSKKQQELLTQFTEESVLVKGVREQIAEVEILKKKLEDQNPGLANVNDPSTTVGQLATPVFNPSVEMARMAALESKIRVLNSQLDELRTEAVGAAASEAVIQELQRKKELEEANYRHFSVSLETSKFDETLGAGKTSNISVIQSPSPPTRAKSKTLKMMALAILFGVCGGFALAFVTELKLDTSVKRPIDVETKLRIPLFLSIPQVSKNGFHSLPGATRNEPLLLAGPEGGAHVAGSNGPPADHRGAGITPWNHNPGLRRFHEALRDRLIVDFERRSLTHKPKLLAVTSCGKGAGVTTVAAGLAACLSETGEGNVLLVDMTKERAAAQHFWRGKPECSLNEALYDGDRAQVQDNLYVATETTNGDGRPQNVPLRFAQLVPKLKAGKYDYIIFDMPPISQTSVTALLAPSMDQVVLVIESEKTERELVDHATALLAQSKASVCAVLNKTQNYVPTRLHQGLLIDT